MKGQKQAPRDNYKRKLGYLMRIGAIPTGIGAHLIDVQHDSWCSYFEGRPCNCNPDISVRASVSAVSRN